MSSARKQRKSYIVDKPFQLGFIKKISILVVVYVVFSLIAFALTYHMYGEVSVPGVDPLYDASKSTMDALSGHGTVFDILWPVMAVTLCVILLITFVYGMILSHRMAGPLYRLRQELKHLLVGDPRPDISLREGDEFENLYEEVNGVKMRYRAMVDCLQRVMSELDDDNPQDARKELASLLHPKDDDSRNDS